MMPRLLKNEPGKKPQNDLMVSFAKLRCQTGLPDVNFIQSDHLLHSFCLDIPDNLFWRTNQKWEIWWQILMCRVKNNSTAA
jgi:hypothetical protein